jgi:hypothetical protein
MALAATVYTVICAEDPREVGQLREDFIALYRPVDSQELFAIERMALGTTQKQLHICGLMV